MTYDENIAANRLIETGSLVQFNIIEQDIHFESDGIDSWVKVALQMIDESSAPGHSVVEWGAFGFIFLLASLSFEDARPRGMSDREYNEHDVFTIADLFECLKFTCGELYFYADYVSGRYMKTHITIERNGKVVIATRNRGKALIYWLDRLQGKKNMQLIKGDRSLCNSKQEPT